MIKNNCLYVCLSFLNSLPNVSDGIRWSLDLRWQKDGTPDCLWGIKEGVTMRRASDPNYQIDWTHTDSVNRASAQIVYIKGEELVSEHFELARLCFSLSNSFFISIFHLFLHCSPQQLVLHSFKSVLTSFLQVLVYFLHHIISHQFFLLFSINSLLLFFH